MPHTDVIVIHGWGLYAHPLFAERLASLTEQVAEIANKDPEGFAGHPAAKLLMSVRNAMRTRVPANPDANDFRLGKSLGKGRSAWRRVKHGLPPRYRLFFRFNSTAPKAIIFVWLNDEATLRKEGAKTDVYAVFSRLVESGRVPATWEELMASSDEIAKVS